jgi:hypothetical protein
MTRVPELAPSWLPRQQRCRIGRQLRKLFRRDVCSICGSSFKHNSQTVSGLDAQGKVVLAGECCTSRVAVTFGRGLYSGRKSDFLLRREPKSNTEPVSNEQIAKAIATHQEIIADADKEFAHIERWGGGIRATHVGLLDTPWKDDDRKWFVQNHGRSHRMRPPFPGELDQMAAELPAGRTVIMLVRQVAPGQRLKVPFDPDVILLPGSPHDEAFAHALFEVAVGREAVPPNAQALDNLVKKYAVRASQ